MANVYHQAGLLHSALVAAGAALHLSPRFVVIHFTLANIYAAMGDLGKSNKLKYSGITVFWIVKRTGGLCFIGSISGVTVSKDSCITPGVMQILVAILGGYTQGG